jgi:hypothetical protein
LLPAQPRDPGALAAQRPSERLGLAHGAARLALLEPVIEAVGAEFAHVRLHRVGPGREDLDVDAIKGAHAIDEIVRLARQPSGVEGEDADPEPFARDQVEEHHVLGAEARGERCRRVRLLDLREQLARPRGADLQAHRAAPARRLRKSGAGSSTLPW